MMPVMMFDVVFNVEIQLMQVIPVMQVDKCRFPKCGCRDAMQTLNTNTVTMKYASIEVDKCRFPKCGCRDAMQTLNTNTVTMKYASIEVIMMTQ